MQSSEFSFLLERVGRERGLSSEILLESVKEALTSAYKKKYDESPRNLRVILDEEKGKVQVLVDKEVVEKVTNSGIEISLEEAREINDKIKLGDQVKIEVNPFHFSRIAASTGKYVMMQQIVEMEKDLLYEEFKKREGEIISGTVRYKADHFILIDLGKTEGILPVREQLLNREYRQGERIRTYILRVTREPKGPRIILSQTHPIFLKRLFELEVPEVEEGIVKIIQIKRDAGRRAKVVVESGQKKVDAVGACVGLRGSRIKAILRELEGERVDIIRYSEEPSVFIKNSLKPAEVKQVKLDEANKEAKVIVADDQLSLAIGSRGENVKLAAKLTGWQIDIRSLGQIEEESAFLRELSGVGEKTLIGLKQAGFLTHKDIIRGGIEGLCKVSGIGPKLAEKIFDRAKEISQ
ncbi:transcription termination/antitermination protein NusA [Candidatus Aerophobetes bacterium]|uniref:Transcription termination/antitermination protein NusA n=1 Tax=Aerophobetes bacterium TaxID=2030807 RepID=A0A523YNV2_UNCAE|nr:MAG: transcription termination/antitermination protein NusA [Candidatus Aerophobetes bacterium]